MDLYPLGFLGREARSPVSRRSPPSLSSVRTSVLVKGEREGGVEGERGNACCCLPLMERIKSEQPTDVGAEGCEGEK